jgi:hypothetical protein
MNGYGIPRRLPAHFHRRREDLKLKLYLATLSAALAAAQGTSPPVTFHKDIEPILQNRCQSCHRPGEVAPMSLLTYQETRPWAKAIRAAGLSGKMPPWHADPRYGKFSNDLSLAPGEKETLAAWVDSGAHEGNPADAPKPRAFVPGWKIPKPDIVFEMPEEFDVPAAGAVDYQFFAVATNFIEDKWVEMAEVRPGDPSVVHHAIVMVESNDGWLGQQYLAGYAPGMMPQMWKPGQARLIKAGSRLVFQVHYTTNGRPSRDRTRIGLVFAKKPAAEQILSLQAMPASLAIPPGDANYRVQSAVVMQEAVSLVGMRAHMHLRGKSFVFRAVYPTGEIETLLDIPHFDFDWQPYYYLDTPKLLPRGTRIECTAVFDNSPNNRYNPDPSATVFWGPQTWDEMMIGWLDVAVPPSSPAMTGLAGRRLPALEPDQQ